MTLPDRDCVYCLHSRSRNRPYFDDMSYPCDCGHTYGNHAGEHPHECLDYVDDPVSALATVTARVDCPCRKFIKFTPYIQETI